MGLIIIVLLVWVFEMQLKNKILFVCMGNICRSPTAEGAFRSIVENKNLGQNFDIDSAGTHAYHMAILQTREHYKLLSIMVWTYQSKEQDKSMRVIFIITIT